MDGWSLVYDGFDPAQEGLREALCTLGNGVFATRAAACWATADEVHYPGTYIAGCYDRLTSEVAGHSVENEDLVNAPNWLLLTLRIEDGDWLDLRAVELLSYRQTLDLQAGVLCRQIRFADAQGRRTALAERRLVHMARPHLAAIELSVTPENWSGGVVVRSALDGRVVNAGVARYRDLRGDHLEPVSASALGEDGLLLKVRTRQSEIRIAQAARTRVWRDGRPLDVARAERSETAFAAQDIALDLREGTTTAIEKVVALYTSRDRAISECALEAADALADAESFDSLLQDHTAAWADLWQAFDIELEDGEAEAHERVAQILRLHVFHLLQTSSLNSIDLDCSVPARGLTGEAYRGHIFWDELFVFPLLNLRKPEITRALLLYRYRRLDAARRAARQAGYRGALYPWQSGSNGREETQSIHLNPRSGRWTPDSSHLQRHVNAAIVYNVWQYYQVTGDLEFMSFYGAEMIYEIARFWASLARFDPARGRYVICGVVGPDEYHEAYPDAERPGLDNNAYTNVMAVWSLCRALELPRLLPEDQQRRLALKLGLDEAELAHWGEVSRRMYLAFHDGGIISQFEGYADLEEFDWEGYRARYGDIQRLDRILKAEDDTPDRYKASKQADVLMLFYLLSADTLHAIFDRLGYPFAHDLIPRTVDYYLQRTSHGSTLSRVVHAWVLSRRDRSRAWSLFTEALESDVADIQGGTTAEGVHLGAMAGTVDLVQRCFTGIETRGDILFLNPCLPEGIGRLRLNLRYRGHAMRLDVAPERLRIRALRCQAAPLAVHVQDRTYALSSGESLEITVLPPAPRATPLPAAKSRKG